MPTTTPESPKKQSPWSKLLVGRGDAPPSLELGRVLQYLLATLRQVAPDHAGGIFLVDEETRTIQGQVTDFFDPDLSLGGGLLQTALRDAASFVISSIPPVLSVNDSRQG